MLSSLASFRRPCRSRLPQCPQGPASPLGWWASPKPGRCNCAGVSHFSPTQMCVGCILAPVDVFICLVKYLKALSFDYAVCTLQFLCVHPRLYTVLFPLFKALIYKRWLLKCPRSPSDRRRQPSVLLQRRSEWAAV